MASYQHLLQHKKPRIDSPAKVFAKLKAKVLSESMSVNEGVLTSNHPLCNAREEHRSVFNSPRKKAGGVSITDMLKENQKKFGSHHNEVQALTLSPISSPRKHGGYSEISPLEEMGRGHTRRERSFLESTAMSHVLIDRGQIHKGPPQIRDDFKVPRGTLIKKQSDGRSVFEEDRAPLNTPLCPTSTFSPMKKRLRKRKWEQRDIIRPQERETPAFSEDGPHNNTKDLGIVKGFSGDRSEMTLEPTSPTIRSATEKRYNDIVERFPPMSPAKIFAYMKGRESKKELQKDHAVNRGTRVPFDGGTSHQSREIPLPTAHIMEETGDINSTNSPESVVAVNEHRVDSTDNQSETNLAEDFTITAVPVVLHEDPLVLKSPQISIPKKHDQAVFKRNQCSRPAKFARDNVIYLSKWYLRKSFDGLFVNGIHRETNIPWKSNIIVGRVSHSVLKTVTGRVYILVGKMKVDLESGFPSWFLKKFAKGFPANWQVLYEKFLLESKDNQSKAPVRKVEGRSVSAKTKSETSTIDRSVKRHRTTSLRTPDSCPSTTSLSCTNVSRSGRVIKPPLEYWKGGRVILDGHMNVKVLHCYDTSIINHEVTTTVPARSSQKPVRVFLPSSEGWKPRESPCDKEVSIPLRKVKLPQRKPDRAKVNADEKPSNLPKPPEQTLCSPVEQSGRRRSSRRLSDKVDTATKESEPEKPKTQRSKKRTQDTDKPSVRAPGRKKTVTNITESSDGDKTLQHTSSDDTGSVKGKKRAHKVKKVKKGGKTHNKSKLNHKSPCKQPPESSADSEESVRATKKRDKAQRKHKRSKSIEASPPKMPLPKATQSKRKHRKTFVSQEQDDDEWTTEEVKKLKEAVSYYPKHMEGYWTEVARMVGTRSAEECHKQHTSQGASQTPAIKPKITKKKKVEAAKVPDNPVISARVGTLKRKQQVRQFLEAMPKEDVDDVFSSAFMQNKRFEMPSLLPGDDHDLRVSDQVPTTPSSSFFPEVKTPQCLHITPGMMGSPDRNNDDKYVYQLQKRMKKSQFNVCKRPAASKSFTPTPSVKRSMRRCGNAENSSFVIWEMFSGNEEDQSQSGEEKDFYFSDDDN